MYRMTNTDRILMHRQSGLRAVQMVRDDDAAYNQLDVEALVASGDCFVTIATSLDDCTKLLAPTETDALPQIEKAISVLLYLQRHYKVVRKLP